MRAWGFNYKSNLIWHKVRKDGEPDGRGVGFYFRNTTEIILFGIRGHMRTLDLGRSQVNIIRTIKQEHSRKPDQLYEIIEKCSPSPYLELFARGIRKEWFAWAIRQIVMTLLGILTIIIAMARRRRHKSEIKY